VLRNLQKVSMSSSRVRARRKADRLLRVLLLRESGLGVPRRAHDGGPPLAHPNHLQVALGVLGARERLLEPSLRPGRQHQPLTGHLEEFWAYPGRESPSTNSTPNGLEGNLEASEGV
jgi:hypothetical protein